MLKLIVPGKHPIVRSNKYVYTKKTSLNRDKDVFEDEMLPVPETVWINITHVATVQFVLINGNGYYRHHVIGASSPIYSDMNFLELLAVTG